MGGTTDTLHMGVLVGVACPLVLVRGPLEGARCRGHIAGEVVGAGRRRRRRREGWAGGGGMVGVRTRVMAVGTIAPYKQLTRYNNAHHSNAPHS